MPALLRNLREDGEDMKKSVEQKRFALMIKYWKDGVEKPSFEGTMTTDALRSARAEFRSRLQDVLASVKLGREDMKAIVEAGHVVAAGPVAPDADRFAMILVDSAKPPVNPPMYAFEFTGNGWSMKRFDPTERS